LAVSTDEKGLGPADEKTCHTLVAKLRQDTRDVVTAQDFLSTPQVREVFTAKDKRPVTSRLGLADVVGSPQGGLAYQHVTGVVKQPVAGSTLTANVAGPAATVEDLTDLSECDLHLIETRTAILVLLVLFVFYRDALTMMVPLVTIGLSLVTAQGVLAGRAVLSRAFQPRPLSS
jgi:RND superfamily putative drug exporter